jgi:hypothetical protein
VVPLRKTLTVPAKEPTVSAVIVTAFATEPAANIPHTLPRTIVANHFDIDFLAMAAPLYLIWLIYITLKRAGN